MKLEVSDPDTYFKQDLQRHLQIEPFKLSHVLIASDMLDTAASLLLGTVNCPILSSVLPITGLLFG